MKPEHGKMLVLAGMLSVLTKEQQEIVAAHLLGTVQGMKLEQAMQKEKESA